MKKPDLLEILKDCTFDIDSNGFIQQPDHNNLRTRALVAIADRLDTLIAVGEQLIAKLSGAK